MTPTTAQGFVSRPAAVVHRAQTTHRLAFIEGMRALCAVYVVLGHIVNLVDPSRAMLKPSHAPAWMQSLFRPFQEGHLAVSSFIVISGFCLAHAAYERDDPTLKRVGDFFRRRAARILPAYYACLAISILTALTITPIPGGMPFAQYLPVTRDNVLAHVFLIHNWRPEWMYKINGVLWSIAVEVQLYFLLPGLMRGLRHYGWFSVLVLCIGIALAVLGWVPRGVKLYPWYLPLFFFGAVGADWARRRYLRPELQMLGVAGLAMACYGCAQKWDQPVTDSLFALGVVALLVLGTQAEARNARALPIKLLGWAPLAFVGSFSYSLYLIHHPVLQTLFIFRPKLVHSQRGELLYMLSTALPLALLAAFGFGLLFEGRWVRPAWGRLRQRLAAKGNPWAQGPRPVNSSS
jgi:peptidoglycan/LPS O-acetylase OafA/YrhL